VRGKGDIELGTGCCAWRLNNDEALVADEKILKSFTAASGWRQTKQWTVNASEESVFSPDGAELVYSDSVVNGRDENGYPERTGRLCRLDLNAPGGSPQFLLSEYDTGEIPYLWTRYGSRQATDALDDARGRNGSAQVAAALYADPDVFDVDYYGYLTRPGILDVYPGST
jgi:hypothetical protein